MNKTKATTKTHWKKLYNPNYLGSWSLEPGKDLILNIKEVKVEILRSSSGEKDECTVVYFHENVKPLVLNQTNARMINKIYETPYIEDWKGKAIQLYVDNIRAFGENVQALRIRPHIPRTEKPVLNPNHPKWNGAIKSLKEGTTTIEGIQKHYSLSDTNKDLLMDESL